MFIVLLKYKKSLVDVELYLSEHRRFLDECYQQNFLIVSGPQNPRDGGVIISHLEDKKQLHAILQQDPFYIHGVAEYQFIEFIVNKYHPAFSPFVLD